MEFVILWGIAWGVVCGIVAANKGRSGVGWFFLGFLFAFFAVIVLALIPALNSPPQQIVFVDQGAKAAAPSLAVPQQAPKQERSYVGVLVLAAFAIFIALGKCANDNEIHSKPAHIAKPPTPAPAPERSCKTVWSLCANNEDWLKHSDDATTAQVACRIAADKKARFGDPEWPPAYFSGIRGGDSYIKTGKADLMETNVRFQNGFGAMKHVMALCIFNLVTGTVEKIDIIEN